MSRWAAVAAAALLALGGAWLAAGGDGGGAPSVAGATANSEDGSDQAADGDDEADGDDAMEADGSSPDQVRGRVRLARSEVRSSGGKLARAEMMRSIRRTLPKVRRCYRRALERNPELAGRVTFRLTVEPGGKVSDAKRAGGTLVDAAMTRCATRAIERTRFAKPKGAAAKVTFPLRFRAD